MNHRLFSTAAGLAALAATFAGPSFYASSSEQLVARLPVISETSPSTKSMQSGKVLPANEIVKSGKGGWPLEAGLGETGPVKKAVVEANPPAPHQARAGAVAAKAAQTRTAKKEQPAATPQATTPARTAEARNAEARTAEAKPQDLENSPQFASQRFALDGTTVQQASAKENVSQAPIAGAPQAESSTVLATQPNPQVPSSNVELTAYTHLQALNESQFDPSVSTGRIEQDDYATRADHTDIRPVYVDDA